MFQAIKFVHQIRGMLSGPKEALSKFLQLEVAPLFQKALCLKLFSKESVTVTLLWQAFCGAKLLHQIIQWV